MWHFTQDTVKVNFQKQSSVISHVCDDKFAYNLTFYEEAKFQMYEHFGQTTKAQRRSKMHH